LNASVYSQYLNQEESWYFPSLFQSYIFHANERALNVTCVSETGNFRAASVISLSCNDVSGPRLCVAFRNEFIFYGEGLLAPRPTPKSAAACGSIWV
jgi:hypothetical protein